MDYPSIDMAATGKRIESLISLKGYTLKDLQGYLGFSTSQAIYKWLWGKSLPSIDNLFALSVLLDTSMDDILVGARHAKAHGYTARYIAPKSTSESISYHVVFLPAA